MLEEQVLPAFYERDADGLPPRWIALMRESIAELGPRFGTARMVAEYVERLYLPAHGGALEHARPPRVADGDAAQSRSGMRINPSPLAATIA